MDSEQLWQLFIMTGLPEAYTCYSSLREDGGAVSAQAEDHPQKTA